MNVKAAELRPGMAVGRPTVDMPDAWAVLADPAVEWSESASWVTLRYTDGKRSSLMLASHLVSVHSESEGPS